METLVPQRYGVRRHTKVSISPVLVGVCLLFKSSPPRIFQTDIRGKQKESGGGILEQHETLYEKQHRQLCERLGAEHGYDKQPDGC